MLSKLWRDNMKRLFVLFGIFVCFSGFAETETINWYVENQTYATTTCESGSDIILPNNPTKYGYTFMGWKTNFKPIEYIEGAGVQYFSQYIDTGIKPNQNIKFRVKFNTPAANLAGTVIQYFINNTGKLN